jgi:hypothetical protein
LTGAGDTRRQQKLGEVLWPGVNIKIDVRMNGNQPSNMYTMLA